MKLREKAAKGVFWTAIQNFGTRGVSFITFTLLARLLDPEAFGLVALAAAFIGFLQLFRGQGFGSAIVQRDTLDPEHLDSAFWIQIGIAALLILFTIAGAGFVAKLFSEQKLGPVLRWLSLSFLLSALSEVQVAILRRNLAFKSLASRLLIASPVGGCVGVGMALYGCGVWSLVGQQLSTALTGILVLWSASDWRPGLKISRKHSKDLFRFGVNIMGSTFVNFFSRRADHLLIGYFLGPVVLGYYTVAYRFIWMLSRTVDTTFNTVLWPVFSRMQTELEKLRRAFYSATQLTSLVVFPVFLGLFVVTPELVPTLFGSKWLPSVPVMRVLAFVGLIHSLLLFNESAIVAVGKPSWRFGLRTAIAVCNVIGFFIAVRWGIVAVAISYLIVTYVFAPISLWMIKKLVHLDLRTYGRQFCAPLMASLVMVALVHALRLSLSQAGAMKSQLVLFIMSGAITYFITLKLVSPALVQQVLGLARTVAHAPKREYERSK